MSAATPATPRARAQVPASPAGSNAEPTRITLAAPTEEGLENPRWGKEAYNHEDEVEMLVDGPGLDGRTVKFVVEVAAGGGRWDKIGETTAPVSGGVAVGLLPLPHPAHAERSGAAIPTAVDAGPRTLRFEATLV